MRDITVGEPGPVTGMDGIPPFEEANSLFNAGTIAGASYGVTLQGGGNAVENRGLIAGIAPGTACRMQIARADTLAAGFQAGAFAGTGQIRAFQSGGNTFVDGNISGSTAPNSASRSAGSSPRTPPTSCSEPVLRPASRWPGRRGAADRAAPVRATVPRRSPRAPPAPGSGCASPRAAPGCCRGCAGSPPSTRCAWSVAARFPRRSRPRPSAARPPR